MDTYKERRLYAAEQAYCKAVSASPFEVPIYRLLHDGIEKALEAADATPADYEVKVTMGDWDAMMHRGAMADYERLMNEERPKIQAAMEKLHEEVWGTSPMAAVLKDIEELNSLTLRNALYGPRRKRYTVASMFKSLRNFFRKVLIMATLADNVIALTAAVAALDAKVSALPTPEASTVDLTPVTSAIADVKADTAAILVQVNPSA